MQSFRALLSSCMTISLVILYLSGKAESRPGVPFYHGLGLHYHLPSSASQQTTVVRDVLGNQGTAYAYQTHNGISASAVAVSRSDNSKTLAYLPAVAPALLAAQPFGYAHHQHHAHAHHHYDPALSVAAPAAVYSDYINYVGVV